MRRVLSLGVVGSCLVTVATYGYMPLPHPRPPLLAWALDGVRTHPGTRPVAVATAFVGLVLLTWAWWSLRRYVDSAVGPSVGLARTRLAAALWSVPLLVAPPVLSGDGWSYVATGYLSGHSRSPYDTAVDTLPEPLRSAVDHRWLHTPSPYGNLPLAWGALASHLTSSPWLLLLAYRLLAVLALVLVAWLVPVVARRTGRDPVQASWLLVASPFVVTQGVGGLHNDLLLGALMLAAVAVAVRGNWLAGGVLTGAALEVKVPGAAVGIGVALLAAGPAAGVTSRLAMALRVYVVAAVTVLVVGLATGLGEGWWHALRVPGAERTMLAGPYLAAVVVHRLRFGTTFVPLSWLDLLQKVYQCVVALAAAWLLLRRRSRTTEAALLAAVAGFLLVLPVAAPATHYWYVLWALPLLACVRLPAAPAAALVALVLLLGLGGIADSALDYRWLTDLAVAAVWLGPAAVWLLVRRRERSATPVAAAPRNLNA